MSASADETGSQRLTGLDHPPANGAIVRPGRAKSWLLLGGGLLALCLLALINLSQGVVDLSFADVLRAVIAPTGENYDAVVRYVRLPRVAIGVTCGAGLGMAGVLLQSITRNPLASPSTLGVNAGAYLALVVATIFTPTLLGLSPAGIAFAGGAVAALIAYAMAGGPRSTPVQLVLAGVAVSLVFASLTGVFQLFYENETAGLFFWGAGSLAQVGWGGTEYALPRIAIGALGALLISRQLDILALSDDVARSLGQRIWLTRAGGLILGVFLAAVAVSVVGPIGFVGLIVPHLVRLGGVRSHRMLLLGSAIWGAALLLGADVLARSVTSSITELPAGGITAIIGAPFLIWLIRHYGESALASRSRQSPRTRSTHGRSLPVVLSAGVILLAVVIVLGLAIGDASIGPGLLFDTLRGEGTRLSEQIIFSFRLPRLVVAALAGAALAISGVLLQGVVRNPLAAPEIIGVTQGAGVGALALIVLFPAAPFVFVPVAGLAGGIAAFAIVYVAAWSNGVSPTRLALVGVAMSAFGAAIINLLVVKSGLRVAQALVWLSGSTYARSWDEVLRLAPAVIVITPLAWLVARELDFLALGDDLSRGLGQMVERSRLISLSLAVALAAAAVSVVGTIGFVGLIGPHTARMMLGAEHRHRQLIPVAATFGAVLLVIADTVGRTIAAPREIPSGLVTALIGTPYFLWLLRRQRMV